MIEKVFYFPVKNEEEAYERIIETARNNDYTAGNLLDCAYFKEYYRLIATDLSKQTNNLKDNLKTKFMGQQCFLSLKNQKNLLFSFCKIL